jgi:PAS domain S-box-containing protein
VGRVRLSMDELSSETYSIALAEPVVTGDVATETRFDVPPFMRDAGVRALVNVPIFVPGPHHYGLLQVDATEPRDFGDDEIDFLTTYATILGPVIDRLKKAEALEKEEERYRIVVESARDYAIFFTDPDGIVTDWLSGAEAVFGWTAEEAVGRSDSVLFTPEDREAGEAEKELDVARRNGWSPDVRWHQHKDGHRVFIEGSVTALRGQDDGPRGFLKIGQDVSERRRAEERLRKSEARYKALVEGVPQLVWRAGPGGRWTWASPQWTAYTGLSDEDSRRYGWLDAVHPDDRARALDAWTRLGGSDDFSLDARICHTAARRYRWFATRATAVRDDDTGRATEWLGTCTDIDDLRRLQETQDILLAELQHRTRNLISVVRAVADRTAATSAGLDTFINRFRARLEALARANNLLSRLGEDDRVAFDTLLRAELNGHGIVEADGQVTLEGPEGVRLRSGSLQTFALVLHELATNAVKYGAFAQATGRLKVSWRLLDDGDERKMEVTWLESGIRVRSTARVGYGRELIERALPYQLGAEVDYALGPAGVRCRIVLPISRTAER